MKNFFEKHETLITILLIVIYLLSNLYCRQNFGELDFRTTIVNFTLLLIILIFVFKNNLGDYYGLTKLPKFKDFLYFFPLFIIMSANLWSGIKIENTITEIICFILSMFLVGFIEELIFRGFLFKMMEKDNVKSAIMVSSLTFGIGHIINLLNGASIIPTLIQVCYAIAVGYLFVIIFQKGKSLWPCIVTHAVTNAVSIFNVETTVSLYVVPVVWIIISITYSMYIRKNIN